MKKNKGTGYETVVHGSTVQGLKLVSEKKILHMRYYCDACSNWQMINLTANEQYPSTFECSSCFIVAKFNQLNLSYP